MAEVLAALDCGTNSTRLLIAKSDGTVLHRAMTITRLGQGVDATGALDPEAIGRVLAALEEFRTAMDHHGVVRGRLAATSAVRDASNGNVFLERATEVSGVRAEVLAGSEEAALSYLGATASLGPATGPRLVVDVGGGSAELVLDTLEGLESISLQLGCVRITERCFTGPPPTSAELDHARAVIGAELDRARAAMPHLATSRPVVVGLAGTVATLVQLDRGIEHYERTAVHHQVVTAEALQRWIDQLSHEDLETRMGHAGMMPGRADVLLGGLLVLEAVLATCAAGSLLSSEDDILDGLIASLR